MEFFLQTAAQATTLTLLTIQTLQNALLQKTTTSLTVQNL